MACSSVAKCILILINIIFAIISLAFIIVGSILAFLLDKFPLFSIVYTTAKEAAKAGGYTFPESGDALNELPMTHEVGLALLVLGIILFMISFLGCCGPCYSCCNKMVLLFAIVMLVFMVAEIVVVTMFYVPDSPLHENLRRALKDKVLHFDKNLATTDSFSVAINMFNYYFKCCGIDGQTDFTGGPPDSCTESYNPSTLKRTYYTGGCYTELTDLIQENLLIAGLSFAAMLLFQLIEVIFAIAIFKKQNKVSPF